MILADNLDARCPTKAEVLFIRRICMSRKVRLKGACLEKAIEVHGVELQPVVITQLEGFIIVLSLESTVRDGLKLVQSGFENLQPPSCGAPQYNRLGKEGVSRP